MISALSEKCSAMAAEVKERQRANGQLGEAWWISQIRVIDEQPRSPIGKVLKEELRNKL